MGWYEVIHHERGGKEAGLAALRRIAELPGSWRAQLGLARDALDRRDLPAAISLYQRALSHAEPAPADMLMQISGDLGNQGHLPELLELVGLRFDPGKHGLEVGNNLLKAHVDLGQLDGARQILDQLYALKRPDWKETLIPWIANASGGFVFSGVPWNDSDAAAYARRGPEKNDYIVVTYIRADIRPWKAKLRLVRSIDASCLGELEAAFTVERPEQGVSDLALRLLDLLSRQADTARHSPSAFYQIPSGEHFPYYLLRLELVMSHSIKADSDFPSEPTMNSPSGSHAS